LESLHLTSNSRPALQTAIPRKLRVFLSVLLVANFARLFINNTVLGLDFEDITAWCADEVATYCFSTNSVRRAICAARQALSPSAPCAGAKHDDRITADVQSPVRHHRSE
jgi:hypothetical protein